MVVRTLSAVVLAPLLIWLLLAGPRMWFFVVLLVASGVLLWEWLRLKNLFSYLLMIPLLLAQFLVMYTGYRGYLGWIGLELVLILLALFAWSLVEYRPGGSVSDRAGFRFMGVVYCGVPLMLLDGVRAMPHGGALVCLLLFVVWATDTGAYLVGRKWGTTKLVPAISPGKTWAGFWGGTLAGTAMGWAGMVGFSLPFSWLEGLVLGGVLSMAGAVGDLVESVLKREAGVKDSSQLIPGHGGLLDRLDSLLFVAPLFYAYLRVRGSGISMGAWFFGG
ncbi:MAG: phosphatidate cytidylyltransferase [Magnetococcales bacterium]|nr:phosphatidate cytidylyltransferase [Magnetococcales bacterium]NGZ06761.1 phosphatidate cytidylyltransferase [Magnetococcales bacterium]